MAIDLTPLVTRHAGQWVGLKDDEKTVVASGPSVREVMKRAAAKGYPKPILFRVPSKILPYTGGLTGA